MFRRSAGGSRRTRRPAQDVLERAVRTAPPSPPRHTCLAPSVQLYLAPDGDVRVCCRNWQRLGNVAEDSLLSLWRGPAHLELIERLARGDYSAGCDQCHGETVVEGRADAYPSLFDSFTDAVESMGVRGALPWPTRIEFNLSNSCNLMCIQCDGLLSSAIRAHRDHLPPVPAAYDERFFADIEHFLPHLTEAQFAGGEPFLARETSRVWDLIAEVNPGLPCIVVTNATQWNRRVDAITSRVRMGFTFSIDGITAGTYEAIRVNSHLPTVLANIDRYAEKARAAQMPLEVNFCLMQQNVHEFGEMMLWIESKGFKANVSIVRNPPECSLASLDIPQLRAVVDRLEAQAEAVGSQLGELNRPIWEAELRRLRSWASASDGARHGLWWESDPAQPVTLRSRGHDAHVGADRPDPESWVAAGRSVAVHSVQVVDDAVLGARVVGCSAGVPGLVGLAPEAVVGSSPDALLAGAQHRLGPLVDTVEDVVGDDRVDLELRFERGSLRASRTPSRGPDGEPIGLQLVVAVHEEPHTAA